MRDSLQNNGLKSSKVARSCKSKGEWALFQVERDQRDMTGTDVALSYAGYKDGHAWRTGKACMESEVLQE